MVRRRRNSRRRPPRPVAATRDTPPKESQPVVEPEEPVERLSRHARRRIRSPRFPSVGTRAEHEDRPQPVGPDRPVARRRRSAIARAHAVRPRRHRQSGVRSRRRLVRQRGEPGPRRRARRTARVRGRPERSRAATAGACGAGAARCSKSTMSGLPKTTRPEPRSSSHRNSSRRRWASTTSNSPRSRHGECTRAGVRPGFRLRHRGLPRQVRTGTAGRTRCVPDSGARA